jgi:ABC-type transport system substrate-binding protein
MTNKRTLHRSLAIVISLFVVGACTKTVYVITTEAPIATSTSELQTTIPAPPTTIDPTQQIESIALSLDPNATYLLAEGDCPTVAAVLANQSLKFFQFQDSNWDETPIDLVDNSNTPVRSITVGDYAPNSGQGSFLIGFDGSTLGGPNYGGVLAQYECRWGLVDIVLNGVGKVVIGLTFSENQGLIGYSRAGAEREDLLLSFDPHSFAYFTQSLAGPLDEPFGD